MRKGGMPSLANEPCIECVLKMRPSPSEGRARSTGEGKTGENYEGEDLGLAATLRLLQSCPLLQSASGIARDLKLPKLVVASTARNDRGAPPVVQGQGQTR